MWFSNSAIEQLCYLYGQVAQVCVSYAQIFFLGAVLMWSSY